MDLNTPVEQVMTKEVVSISVNHTLETLNDLFEKFGFHHLPVTNADGSLAGIISKHDIAKITSGFKLVKSPEDEERDYKMLSSMLAEEVMNRYVINLTAEDTIGSAIDIFLKNSFYALPVLRDGILVGIFTTHDILRWIKNNSAQTPETPEIKNSGF